MGVTGRGRCAEIQRWRKGSLHDLSTGEARKQCFKRFDFFFDATNWGTRLDGVAEQFGEVVVRAGKDEFSSERLFMDFADAGLCGEPSGKREPRHGETHVNAACAASVAHDVTDLSVTQELAFFDDRERSANLFEVREHVRSDEDGFAFAMQLAKKILQFEARFGIEAGRS